MRTFSEPQGWIRSGIKTRVPFFRGATIHTAAKLYVKTNGTKVAYPGDAGNLAVDTRTQWNIDLPQTAGLGAVKTPTIGVSGGQGALYIDHIRLYRSAPAE